MERSNGEKVVKGYVTAVREKMVDREGRGGQVPHHLPRPRCMKWKVEEGRWPSHPAGWVLCCTCG